MINHTFSAVGMQYATTGLIWGDPVDVVFEIEKRKKQGWKLTGPLQQTHNNAVLATMERSRDTHADL